jgi:chromosome segregation ATPase
VEQLPEMPYAGHLAPVLALHEFQESFKNLQDLVFLGQNLGQWQNKLEIYTELLARRNSLLSDYLSAGNAAQAASRFDALQSRRRALAEQVTRADAAGDAAPYGSAGQQQARQRLAAAQAEIAAPNAAGNSGESEALTERLRRLNGALLWQQQEELPGRRREANKLLKGMEQDIEAARQREAQLRAAQAGAPARLAALGQRVQALNGRISALLPRVAVLRAEQGVQLQDLTIAELLIQRERLDIYAAQARLGIAQVLDRAQITENLPIGATPEGRR